MAETTDAYRFYFVGERGHIMDAEWDGSKSDPSAMIRANASLETRDCHFVEVWQGVRLVGKQPKVSLPQKFSVAG